jgi:cell division protein FtsN
MRDMGKLKEKVELTLDSRQVFFLLFGGAAVACLVFVLGVMVGKRLEAKENPASAQCGAELEALDRLSGETEELTFHKVLVRKGRNPNLPPEVYETANIGEPARKGRSKTSPRVATDSKRRGAPARRTSKQAAKKRRGRKERQELAAKKRADERAKARRKFTLQVSSFKQRAQAEAMVQKLESKGLTPYLISSHIPKRGMWYRVRLGSYEKWSEAIVAKKKFERTWKMTAYVMRRH